MTDAEDYPDLITPAPWQDLLPPNKTYLEQAIAEQTGRLLENIPNPIDRYLQPAICPEGFLPWLAWHVSLDLWDWRWSESKRREVIAQSVDLNRHKGTQYGMELGLKIMGYEALQWLRPPQGFYAAPDLTKDEWDWWIRQMPQIRIKFAEREGYGGDETFAAPKEDITLPPSPYPEEWDPGIPLYGECIAVPNSSGYDDVDVHFCGKDDGWALYGRMAVIRYPDPSEDLGYVEEDMLLVEWEDTTTTLPNVKIGRASTTGKAALETAFFANPEEEGLVAGTIGSGGVGFVGEDAYVCFDEISPKLVSYRIDGSYEHTLSELHLDFLSPGMDPIDVRFERDSDIGEDSTSVFSDDVFCSPYVVLSGEEDLDNNFIDNDEWAEQALADRIYLYDENVVTPMMEGISFASVNRISVPPFHADVLVDLKTKDTYPAWYAEDAFEGETFAIPEDLTEVDRACRTLVITKAMRDKIAASFEVTQPLTVRDLEHSSETTTFGEQVRTIL